MLGSLRRPAARRRGHAARPQRPDGRQRLRRPARARPVRPAAHDPGAARRGLRGAPPPRADGARAVRHRPADGGRPEGRHVPRRGGERGLPLPRLGAEADGPPPRPPLRRVARRRGPRRERARRHLRAAVQRGRGGALRRRARCTPPTAPPIFFLGRHEPRKGLEVLLAALADLPPDVRVWVGGDGPQTEELQERYRARRAHRVARPHQRRGALGPDARLHRVLLAVGARRVLRDGPARGDGVGLRAGGLRPRRAPQRGQRRRRRPPRAGRRRGGAGQGPAPGARRRGPAGRAGGRAAGGGPSSSRWRTWPSATRQIYRRRGATAD